LALSQAICQNAPIDWMIDYRYDYGHHNMADGPIILERGNIMAESVYKIITLVGTSTESWEKAAAAAVEQAAKSLRGLRIAEIEELDMQLDQGKVVSYRAKVRVSFKYEG